MLIKILMPTYSVIVIWDGNIGGDNKSESTDHVSCSGFNICAGHFFKFSYWDKVKAPVAELNETNWKALQCIGEGRAIWYGVLNQPNTNYADTQALIQPQMPQLKYELGAHRGQRGKGLFVMMVMIMMMIMMIMRNLKMSCAHWGYRRKGLWMGPYGCCQWRWWWWRW